MAGTRRNGARETALAGAAGRPGGSAGEMQGGPRVHGGKHLLLPLKAGVNVALGGLDGTVAQDLFHLVDVAAGVPQIGGEGVAKHVGRIVAGLLRKRCAAVDDPANRLFGQALSLAVEKKERLVGRKRRPDQRIGLKRLDHRRRRQVDAALPAAFSPDQNHLIFQVQVVAGDGAELRDPHSAGKQKFQHRHIAKSVPPGGGRAGGMKFAVGGGENCAKSLPVDRSGKQNFLPNAQFDLFKRAVLQDLLVDQIAVIRLQGGDLPLCGRSFIAAHQLLDILFHLRAGNAGRLRVLAHELLQVDPVGFQGLVVQIFLQFAVGEVGGQGVRLGHRCDASFIKCV